MSHKSEEPAHVTAMPSDAVVTERLGALGANVSGWANGPGDRYPAHDHGYDKVLVVLSGTITFRLPATGQVIELRAGDRLDLPAGTSHAASVGEQGVRCLEAHLPTSSSGSRAQRVAGWALGTAATGTRPVTETADGTGT